jgi:hypothetical protein
VSIRGYCACRTPPRPTTPASPIYRGWGRSTTRAAGDCSYTPPWPSVTPDRLALGLLHVYSWVRELGSLGQDKDPGRPLEEKESVRWVDGFARVNDLAERLFETGTRLTYVAEREGDIYDTFVEAPCPERGADWLIRGQQDRKLTNGKTLRQALNDAPILTETTFDQPSDNGRSARKVHQQIRVARVTLKPPPRPERKLPPVKITALLATEPHPPAGAAPVEWLLLTNLPIDTPEQALEKLSGYLCRWQIEIYFRILKSGCRIEELPLQCYVPG